MESCCFDMAVDPKAVDSAQRAKPGLTRQSLHYELPRFVRTRNGGVILPQTDLDAFVRNELDVSRLGEIENCLWLAGRLQNIRPLHRQQLLGRKILVSEQADLHLLWQDDKIFVKPLPAWLLDHDFFQNHVRASPALPAAVGFVSSYILLVSYEIDFILAKELHLLPSELEWKDGLILYKTCLHASC